MWLIWAVKTSFVPKTNRHLFTHLIIIFKWIFFRLLTDSATKTKKKLNADDTFFYGVLDPSVQVYELGPKMSHLSSNETIKKKKQNQTNQRRQTETKHNKRREKLKNKNFFAWINKFCIFLFYSIIFLNCFLLFFN